MVAVAEVAAAGMVVAEVVAEEAAEVAAAAGVVVVEEAVRQAHLWAEVRGGRGRGASRGRR